MLPVLTVNVALKQTGVGSCRNKSLIINSYTCLCLVVHDACEARQKTLSRKREFTSLSYPFCCKSLRCFLEKTGNIYAAGLAFFGQSSGAQGTSASLVNGLAGCDSQVKGYVVCWMLPRVYLQAAGSIKRGRKDLGESGLSRSNA